MTRFFKEPNEVSAEVVFATHQVLPYIPFIANKGDWHVLVDEELQVLRYRSHRIPKTHRLITDHIELEPYNAIYSQVVIKDRSVLEKTARNKDRDEILEILADTIRTLLNTNWNTYVNTEQYDRLRHREGKRLAFHSILDPEIMSGFGSVFMAAANFEDTAIYQLWRRTQAFELDEKFSNSLRFQAHTNGHLITIYYAMNEQWLRIPTDCGQDSDASRTAFR
jgi:hypothetical protein